MIDLTSMAHERRPEFVMSDIVRLSSVNRWAIIEMFREQSVAEHSYNVAMIATMILTEIPHSMPGWDDDIQGHIDRAVEWALVHDLTELSTGDMPSPVKRHLKSAIESMEAEVFPQWTKKKVEISRDWPLAYACVKVADWIDAIQFANKWCADYLKLKIIDEMRTNLYEYVTKTEQELELGGSLRLAMSKVWIE